MADRQLQGWCADPFRLHEERYFSSGRPTKLVRDGKVESYEDPPSDTVPTDTEGFEPAPDLTPGSDTPGGHAPNGYAPNRYAPNRYAPNRYAPNGYAPNRYAPNRYALNGYAGGAPPRAGMVMYISGYGSPVQVTAPPSSDTISYRSFLQALGAKG